MTDDDAIVSCVTLTGSEYVAMLTQAAELAKEITSLLNLLADARTESMRLRAALHDVLGWHDYSNDMHKPIEVRAAYMRARAALEGRT